LRLILLTFTTEITLMPLLLKLLLMSRTISVLLLMRLMSTVSIWLVKLSSNTAITMSLMLRNMVSLNTLTTSPTEIEFALWKSVKTTLSTEPLLK